MTTLKPACSSRSDQLAGGAPRDADEEDVGHHPREPKWARPSPDGRYHGLGGGSSDHP
jgi:hypothetical protein